MSSKSVADGFFINFRTLKEEGTSRLYYIPKIGGYNNYIGAIYATEAAEVNGVKVNEGELLVAVDGENYFESAEIVEGSGVGEEGNLRLQLTFSSEDQDEDISVDTFELNDV